MLERILQFSIRHRLMMALLAAAVAAVGWYSLRQLPIDAVPDITNNQVQVNTLDLSLSPAEIEKWVTFPIETALAGIPGLQYTRSLSRNGFSQVTAVFADDVDINTARTQIDQRLRVARQSLPPRADPVMGPVTTGLGEVYMWAVDFEHRSGEGTAKRDGEPGWQTDGSYLTPERQRLTTHLQRLAYLRTVQDWVIRPQLKQIEGVAEIDSLGGYEKQYVVQPDPMKLLSYGLTFSDVAAALERNNSSRGAGAVERHGDGFPVRIAGLLETPAQIANVKLAEHEGAVVRVRDVASVAVGGELRTGSASLDGHEVVIGTAMMRIGANSRTVASAVDARVAEVNRSLPPDVRATAIYDRTKLVDATIHTVAENLSAGAGLVIVILFLLLGNFRAALITALAIPLSMLATATGMLAGKVSGNLMSLGAIDFGIIVDGSVIIVENCLRLLARRQHQLGRALMLSERLETVFRASKQVRGATAFGEAIIIIVYLPVLALTGVEGKMFRPMALTVIFALAAAFVLSLTFVPAMVALCMGGRLRESESVFVRRASSAYAPLLRRAVRLRWVVVPAAAAAFAASLLLFLGLGQEFIPKLDEQDVDVQVFHIPGTGLAASQRMQVDVERVLGGFPEVQRVFSKTGTAEVAADPMPVGQADTFAMLKPRRQWPDPHLPKDVLTDRFAKALAAVPGSNFGFSQPIQDRFEDLLAGTKGDVAVKVFGDDFAAMNAPARAIADLLRTVPGARDVKVEQTEGLPLMTVTPDRAALARYGLDVADVQDVVAAAVGGQEAGAIQEGDRRFTLVVRLPEEMRQDPNVLKNLPVPLKRARPREGGPAAMDAAPASAAPAARKPAASFDFIPLSQVASVGVEEGLNEVTRENGKRRVTVTCNVRGRDLGSFVAEARQKTDERVKMPPGCWPEWGGQYQNLLAARQRLLVVVPICFVLILVLLYATFDSARYALIVFSGVPLALTGGVVALWLRGIPFSISAAVGFIALSGVAVLNGLVLVTFINQLRAEGIPLDEAVLRGPLIRLRPVLMTALVASLGFIPMALATGTGAEVQRPLATVVIGGIVSSTVLTLFVLPALYRLCHRREPAGGVRVESVPSETAQPQTTRIETARLEPAGAGEMRPG